MSNIPTLSGVLLICATVATAMVAGLLFSFAHSVMPGLGTLDGHGFLTGFQRIDAAISNPWMVATFVGSPVLTVAALVTHVVGRSPAVPWVVVALVLVAVTILITAVIHLPLNAAVQDAAPDLGDAAVLRDRFEKPWVRWNVVRTVTSTGALCALCSALFVAGRSAA